jgi:3-oxoadipate enol-lactonase
MTTKSVALPTGPVVAYEDTGGKGVPIVFSHGLFMDHTMFAPQVARFAARWRCIAWDERAHGATKSSGHFTYWDSARDLLALLDALGIERAIHVGMSQGGLLGMRAAILAPRRFAGLVQLATQAGKLDEEAVGPFKALMSEWIARGATEDTLQFLVDLILGPGVDPTYWRACWKRLTSAQLDDALSALYSIDELYARLREVVVPLCTIHGLADVSTPHPLAERVAREVPNPRGITLIENGPHAVNLSHPAEVNAALQAFLDTLTREDPSIRG